MSTLILTTKTDGLNNQTSRVEVWFSKQRKLCQVRGEWCTATPCFVLLKSTSSHYSSLSAWPKNLVLRHLQRFGQKHPSAHPPPLMTAGLPPRPFRWCILTLAFHPRKSTSCHFTAEHCYDSPNASCKLSQQNMNKETGVSIAPKQGMLHFTWRTWEVLLSQIKAAVPLHQETKHFYYSIVQQINILNWTNQIMNMLAQHKI